MSDLNYYENLKPIAGEKVYAEYDEEFSTWAVFGAESGFCYAQPSSKEEAEQYVEDFNA